MKPTKASAEEIALQFFVNACGKEGHSKELGFDMKRLVPN